MTVREELQRLDVIPSKGRGQNFLLHQHHVEAIVRFAEIKNSDIVVEVGPGLGALTGLLVNTATQYFCIDIEARFCNEIARKYPQIPGEHIICNDARNVELSRLLPAGQKCAVVSNVPYSVSSEIVFWLLRERNNISHASLLLQREFAERLAAGPGSKTYGSITVQRSLYASAKLGFIVPGSAFYPSADVESRVVRLDFYKEPKVNLLSADVFETVVRAAFSTRRKTLLNALAGSGKIGAKQEVLAILEKAAIEPSRRAETLNLEEFAALANVVVECCK